MRQDKLVWHLFDPVPGTTADLELNKFIATKRDERESWSKIRSDIEKCKNHDGYCPRIIEEPPFNGRIILVPGSSSECPEFCVITAQGFRLIFRAPEESKYGLSLDWDGDPGYAGKDYGGFLELADDEYILTLLSIDRKRSLIIKTWEESVKNALVKALSTPQSRRIDRKQIRKLVRQIDRTVWCSETLNVQVSDPRTAIKALASYRSYLDDVNAATCRDLIEAARLRARPVGSL
jgi:hypothetical protein